MVTSAYASSPSSPQALLLFVLALASFPTSIAFNPSHLSFAFHKASASLALKSSRSCIVATKPKMQLQQHRSSRQDTLVTPSIGLPLALVVLPALVAPSAASAQEMGLSDGILLGAHEFALPVLYSLLAGLSTGIGGFFAYILRKSPQSIEKGVTAMMLGTAAAAMVTVSIVDLFLHISEGIGMDHTVLCSSAGAATVLLFKFFAPLVLPAEDDTDTEDSRLWRVGVVTSLALTAHNFPEGMAVAISTMGSATLGLKLTVAIALHNIPEGLAIACPLIMSRQYSPIKAVGVAMLSGLSEPVGALLTLFFFRDVITQERIDYALAFVGGVMMAVALAELLPEAKRLNQPGMTALGVAMGTVIMGASLYVLDS